MDPLGAFESVEAGSGEDEGVALSVGELLEACVYVSPDLYEGDVGAKGEDLGSAARAGGAYAAAFGEGVKGPVWLAYPDVAGVGALGDGSEGELRGYFGGEVFEAMNGEVDAAFFEGLFDLLDEDAFAVEVWGRDEAGLLHAVAGGADDFQLYVVAGIAEGVEDVVRLPEGELGASGAYADGIARIVVFACHVFLKDTGCVRGGYPLPLFCCKVFEVDKFKSGPLCCREGGPASDTPSRRGRFVK